MELDPEVPPLLELFEAHVRGGNRVLAKAVVDQDGDGGLFSPCKTRKQQQKRQEDSGELDSFGR